MSRIRTLAASLILLAIAAPAYSALTVGGLGVPDRLTVATTWSTITLPAGTEYVRVRPISVTGYVTVNCTDGAAVSDDYATLAADTVEVIAVHSIDRNGGLCLAGSAGGTVELWPMARGR